MQKGANLKAKDFEHLTSIVNLYDILSVALTFVMENIASQYHASEKDLLKIVKDKRGSRGGFSAGYLYEGDAD